MKFSVCLFTLAFLAVGCGAFGGCRSDRDCEPLSECCTKQYGFFGQCLPRPQEGEDCVPETEYNKFFKKGVCACAPGFECRAGPKGKIPGMEFVQRPVCKLVETSTLNTPQAERRRQ